MPMSEEEIKKISEIVRDNLTSKESLDLIYDEDITEFVAQMTGKITVEILRYLEKRYPHEKT